MTDSQHVFVSYVHEDSDRVDLLCKVLEAAQIPYWRDRNNLGPGDAWKTKIREAIQSNALVFLPCFSERSRAKSTTHMNEELTLAVDEFRKMPPGRVWLMPVRFDDGPVPVWDLGAGRSLGDLNYVDLFGDAYAVGAAALVAAVSRLMGESGPDAATVQAAVAQADEGDRPSLVRRLTKEMLPDPARRIELDDTIRQETRTVLTALDDSQRFPIDTLPGATRDQQIVSVVEYATAIWHLVQPFCESLQVATRWADLTQLAPWTAGLRSFGSDATKVRAGFPVITDLRHIPLLVSTMAVGLTGVGSDRWENVKALVVDPTVTGRGSETAESLINVSTPWSPFANLDMTAHALARATVFGEEPAAALAVFTVGRVGQYHTPVNEWLHAILRPMFLDLFPDDETYNQEFDRAEIMLGLISADIGLQRAEGTGSSWRRSRWFGRSTWRAGHSHPNMLAIASSQLDLQQADWAPLRGGLFGRDPARARAAIDTYRTTFDQVSNERSW
ncbi:TIR domain-containing protein [Nakamurella panacisegetis]|uniref:TIR domain-containing protein n=1 Tax=Nakamurella panacisegetis TaxID=1090615 RepID=A0A1H0TA70_9ACTN|nr:toll/interleukin-1 receptor domain-containing protein [Nakamurella panacisegetis]SDP50701.1 TIR domain-containing protein [Nakamurella panacisegetis]